MGNEVYSAAVAIGLGALVGTALFVPFVAVSYRRRGRLTFGRSVLWAAALVYFLAIWTYTLLPLPESGAYACAGVNLDVLAFVQDLRSARSLTDFAVLQLALNVLLFLPLGFFLRVLGGRGILVAFVAGLGISLIIETTQLTGVWGIYPCAYRVFDVDDLLTNTVGAVLGSLLALIVPSRLRSGAHPDAGDAPHPVTRPRRLLAMLCDWLGAGLVGAVVGIGVQVVLEYLVRDHAAVVDGGIAQTATNLVPIVVWAAVTLVTGRRSATWRSNSASAGGRSRPRSPDRCASWAGSAATCCSRCSPAQGRPPRSCSRRRPSSQPSRPAGDAGCRACSPVRTSPMPARGSPPTVRSRRRSSTGRR